MPVDGESFSVLVERQACLAGRLGDDGDDEWAAAVVMVGRTWVQVL